MIISTSDFHLGHEMCRIKMIEDFLLEVAYKAETLILVGDVLDLWVKNIYTVLERNKRILELLSELPHVIWIKGNHDCEMECFKPLLKRNIKIVREYVLEMNKKRILFTHGHDFDRELQSFFWLAKIGAWIIDYLGKFIRFNISENIYGKKNYQKILDEFKIQVLNKHGNDYDIIVTGHTHVAFDDRTTNARLINTGDWVESDECMYVIFKENEEPVIKTYTK